MYRPRLLKYFSVFIYSYKMRIEYGFVKKVINRKQNVKELFKIIYIN